MSQPEFFFPLAVIGSFDFNKRPDDSSEGNSDIAVEFWADLPSGDKLLANPEAEGALGDLEDFGGFGDRDEVLGEVRGRLRMLEAEEDTVMGVRLEVRVSHGV